MKFLGWLLVLGFAAFLYWVFRSFELLDIFSFVFVAVSILTISYLMYKVISFTGDKNG